MNTMPDQPSQWIFRVPHSMSVACSSEVAHSTHYDQQLQLIQAKIPPVIQFSAGSTPGTFMWDQQRHELCVRPCEVQGLVNEALEMARKEGLSNISFLEDELQVPHFYEDSQTFANQFLYNLVEVDMKQLSFVHQKLWESQGHCMPPIELVQKGMWAAMIIALDMVGDKGLWPLVAIAYAMERVGGVAEMWRHTPSMVRVMVVAVAVTIVWPGSVDSAVPLGREDDIEAGHCLDEELGMVFGPAAGFEGEGAWTKEEYEDFRTMLTQNKGFMSTSATDLPGYSGEMGKGINELSLRDRTPPRLPEDLFHDIGKDQYISKLDLRSGFHQILLTDDASRKTCFWWAREGAAPEQYVYKRMPFGCTNSTAMFCRVIEHELRGLRCAKVYCDDILITSPTARDHIKDVASVIERLSQVGLRGHPGKSVFAAAGCEFLGFLLRPGRLSPHQAKVAAIKELPTPTDVRGLRAVLGFMNFYRIMAARIGEDGYSTLAWPLNCLLRKGNENIKELWGEEHDKALAALKERLTEPGIVVHAYDPSRPLYLMTD
eukprot:gene7166-8545_t